MPETSSCQIAVVHTDQKDSYLAGYALGLQIKEALLDVPDVVLLFAAPHYEHHTLLRALHDVCHPGILLGCSSAGEFTSEMYGVELSCALAIRSSDMRFSVALCKGLQNHGGRTAVEALSLPSDAESEYPYKTALVLADALAGQLDLFLEYLTAMTGGEYEFVGGGAGDTAQFRWTPVFCETQVIPDAAVILFIQSRKPIGIGASHGWCPASPRMQATSVCGTQLIQLDNKPAIEVLLAHAETSKYTFNREDPLPFFLHNLIGIAGPRYRLRVPLGVTPEGAIYCAAAIPEGAQVCVMSSTATAPVEAAIEATRMARERLRGCEPVGALFFDCVATRLRLQTDFGFELAAVRKQLGPIPYAGCNTHGQIIRTDGQWNGFHNCTAVVCLFPS